MFKKFIEWLKSLFKKPVPPPPQTITFTWGVEVLNTSTGTQCVPKLDSNGSASDTDWSIGIQALGQPGVMYKATDFSVSTTNAPGYLSVVLQRYLNGQPVPGWVPSAVLTNGSKSASVDLGGAFVEGEASMQAQVGLSPNANGSPVTNLKISLTLVKA
jgi:hypothetical protein